MVIPSIALNFSKITEQMILPMICREFYKSGYGIMYSANGWVYIWGYKGLFWGANWGTWGRGDDKWDLF